MLSAKLFMLETRKELILRLIIEDYILMAEPVGSKQLADHHHLDISSATIRNEMSNLEQEGYLHQPHTSAGRVPTEKAYMYYLQNIVEQEAHQASKQFVQPIVVEQSITQTLKSFAHRLVDVSGETAIVAFDPGWSYYTGVSNLFAKPDFCETEILRSLSMWIDRFDGVISSIQDQLGDECAVYIGSENPFGNHMATILVRCRLLDDQQGVLGLIGPIRMNYGRNIALIEEARELITQMYA